MIHRSPVCSLAISSLLAAGLWLVSSAADAAEAPALDADKQALAELQAFVGAWRGVGLPKRGSNQGAWTERAAWEWRFADGRAELVGELEGNKYFNRLQIRRGDRPEEFVVLAAAEHVSEQAAGSGPARYRGTLTDGALVATADDAADKLPARISIRLVASGDRMLILYEKRQGEEGFARLAEVGSTREGSSFAKTAASGPECVVTGGLGTIAVEHDGKTYYVCCSGCRDLFNEQPGKILAEYREKKGKK